MNSSRFGGFKTADGATQNKGHHPQFINHPKVSMAGEEVLGFINGSSAINNQRILLGP